MVIGVPGVTTAAVVAHVEEEYDTGTDHVTTHLHSMAEIIVLEIGGNHLSMNLAMFHFAQVKK